MKTWDVGTEGNQNFPIKNKDKVDSLHARITFDEEKNVWTVEDLHSRGGTFIVNMQGMLVQVRKKRINEFTRIVLTDTTAMGMTFFPHHLLESNPKNYKVEFQYVVRQYWDIKEEKEKLDERIRLRRMQLSLVPGIASCVLGVGLRFAFRNSPNMIFTVIGMMSALTAMLNVIIAWYNNKDRSIMDFAKRMQRHVMCPQCGRMLSEQDIQNQMCPFCKAHA